MKLLGMASFAVGLVLVGCTSSGTHDTVADADLSLPDSDPGAPDADPGAPIFGSPAGSISVAETRHPASPTAYGDIRATFSRNRTSFHREEMRSGACRLLRYEASFCNPACEFNELCSEEGCVPFPTFESAGTISLTGLTAAITLSFQSGYYYPDQNPPADLFADDAVVTASAPGGDFSGFNVSSGGVSDAQLVLGGAMDDELMLVDGADVTLSWGASEPGSRVRLTLPSPNDGHGLPFNTIIECDAADGGSLVIPAALVEAFPAQDRTEICVGHDCPLSSFMRYRRGTASTASGEVELLVGSTQLFFLSHATN